MTADETSGRSAEAAEVVDPVSRLERGGLVSLVTGQRGVYEVTRWREITEPLTLAAIHTSPGEGRRDGWWREVSGYEVSANGEPVQWRVVRVSAAGIGLVRPAVKPGDRVRERRTRQEGTVEDGWFDPQRPACVVEFDGAGRVPCWYWNLELVADRGAAPQPLPPVAPKDYVWVDGLERGARDAHRGLSVTRPFWLEVVSAESAGQSEGRAWLTLGGWAVGEHGTRGEWRELEVSAAGIGRIRHPLSVTEKVRVGRAGRRGTVRATFGGDDILAARRTCEVAFDGGGSRTFPEWSLDPAE